MISLKDTGRVYHLLSHYDLIHYALPAGAARFLHSPTHRVSLLLRY